MSEEPDRQIALPIVGKPDARERMYGKIALRHGQLRQAQRLAAIGKTAITLNAPRMLVDLEESIAFLAEEVLRLRAEVEEMKLEKGNG